MPSFLPVSIGALANDDPNKQISRMVTQLNENFAKLSNTQNFSALEIVDQGTQVVTKPANESNKTETVKHNLGYRPFVVSDVNSTGVNSDRYGRDSLNITGTTGTEAGLLLLSTRLVVDKNNLYFKINAPDTGTANSKYADVVSLTFRYWLLEVTSNTILQV